MRLKLFIQNITAHQDSQPLLKEYCRYLLIRQIIKLKEKSVSTVALFEPDEETIISAFVPRAIRMAYFQALLESVAGEQIARRIAMKNATDSATDMIKDMTRLYNRARQAKITQEISEIVAGADSVS